MKVFDTPSQVSNVMGSRIDEVSSRLTTLFSGLQSIRNQEQSKQNMLTERDQKHQERINLLDQARNHLKDR
jgi:hypothetical protein